MTGDEMNGTNLVSTVSPRLGALLTQVTETPDVETALWKVLSEYIDLKTVFLKTRIQEFESKWGMTYEEFSKRLETEALDQNTYDYEVESDFWDWEKAETLLAHYRALQPR